MGKSQLTIITEKRTEANIPETFKKLKVLDLFSGI